MKYSIVKRSCAVKSGPGMLRCNGLREQCAGGDVGISAFCVKRNYKSNNSCIAVWSLFYLESKLQDFKHHFSSLAFVPFHREVDSTGSNS